MVDGWFHATINLLFFRQYWNHNWRLKRTPQVCRTISKWLVRFKLWQWCYLTTGFVFNLSHKRPNIGILIISTTGTQKQRSHLPTQKTESLLS